MPKDSLLVRKSGRENSALLYKQYIPQHIIPFYMYQSWQALFSHSTGQISGGCSIIKILVLVKKTGVGECN
jgi:hypothetical protein